MKDVPTVVFGLDGAHFELLNPWIAEGELPNLKRLFEAGITGNLTSVLPPVTSPAWKAYATGKNPGKLGIFWWENIDVKNRRVHYPTERKQSNTEFWELLAEDHTVGVINVPTTYPPKELDGSIVSGAPDSENSGFTYPPELEERLRSEFGYRVLKTNRLDGNQAAAADEIVDLIDLRFQVARHLYEESDLDFIQVTTFYINSLQHYLWDHEETLRGWKRIDAHLGWFLDRDCNLIVMSDHGSNPIRTVFNINSWLEQNGYLSIETGIADKLYSMGITKDRIMKYVARYGLTQWIKHLVPRSLLQYLPDEEGTIIKEGKTNAVNWDKSTAVASGQGPVYLMQDPSEQGYEELRSELISELSSVTDSSGNPIATAVHRREEVYEGPYLNDAPDIVIEQAAGVHIPGGIGGQDIFTMPSPDGWQAENKRNGLFGAVGPAFNSGTVENLSILDLAPTILHLHNCAVPTDLDGDVRSDLFAEGTPVATRDPTYRSTDTRSEEIRRIRRIAKSLDF